MEKSAWLFIAFGILLLVVASFGSGNINLSPGAPHSDFQVILAIGGLIAIIVGIIKN